MAATLKEVALRSGVSIRTVSRALQGHGDVSKGTRQKVLTVAEELGYRPSLLARALVTRHSQTIGLVIPHLTNPFFAEVAQGVFDTARQNNYNVLMNHYNWQTEREIESWQALGDHAVEGIITALHYGHEPNILTYASTFNPIVVLMREIVYPGVRAVQVDIEQGARKAVEYLARQGHRHIAMLANSVPETGIVERVSAYRRVIAEYGLEEIIQHLPPSSVDPDIAGGRQAALKLLQQHPEVTAIFCYNDLLAIGALQACKETGRIVPDDCAVIGFDDIPIAALVHTPLSTVRVDKYEMGCQAVLRLLEMLDNPRQVFQPRCLPTELVLRESA